MENYKDQLILQIMSIPMGKVCTYGGIAKMAGLPGYARQVGALLRKLPNQSKVPWHRVVNSKGELSFPKDSNHYDEQKSRLLDEGIVFINEKISLSQYLWND